MDFNTALKKGQDFVQKQGTEALTEDAKDVYAEYNKEGPLADRAKAAYADIQENHKSKPAASADAQKEEKK